ncbi:hypothetical protein HPB50_020510 [Hyalomma asiaticum]|uniref:Uncharacterized protein n=1 Tax=Hyalomma asiaticum TaxID=266040 RepID=A0ACB7RMH0_HYAAI|nr:hypothetical protein HPB50_020510 [Hyalomma asiaticum]
MPDRRRPCGVVNDDIGATKEGDVGSGFHVTGADDNNVERELWEQRRQQMWDEIVRMREEYAVLLKSVGYREAKSVAVQTGIESCRGRLPISGSRQLLQAEVEETLPALNHWSRGEDASVLYASSCEHDEQLPLLALQHAAESSLLRPKQQQQAPCSQPHDVPPETGRQSRAARAN